MAAGQHSAPVLIVEDNEDTRDVLGHVLAMRGYTIVKVPDGWQALRYLRGGGEACLIILDLCMPVMDGREFSRALHGDPALADIPIIAYSAGAEIDLDGAVAAVRKAADPQLLLDLVDRHHLPA